MSPSNNSLLGSGSISKDPQEEKIPAASTRVPIWLYHEDKAPTGYLIRTEAELDRVLAEDGWVKTPAMFGKVSEPSGPVVPTPVIPPEPEVPVIDNGFVSPMDTVIDEQPEQEPEVPEDTPVEQEPPPPDPDPITAVFACEICGKEFGSARARSQHTPKCPMAKYKKPAAKRR